MEAGTPEPIDNSPLLCPHGGGKLDPNKAATGVCVASMTEVLMQVGVVRCVRLSGDVNRMTSGCGIEM